ncbi:MULTISPECIES: TOPRIM nucleotidyl transferase/hydrolase domain-containing protein [Streptomyces]|uniref:ATP-dependent endonuclease n=1 Tax=Streptomyces prasinus TaxID=67345 RepID=A0ABX6AVU7_9ACTN|nr:TOPRIM nucleotidyl transferase/hydrolase domain-containing protein [Streptomyces prasinus]QEV06589.1 ATP-dependent endonuclease [Streptomyces prasinus]
MADMRAFREAVTAEAAVGSDEPSEPVRELAGRLSVRTAVLLEGLSDAAAVDALAERRGLDLEGRGICVLPMGGAMSVGRFARLLGPSPGLGLRLTGLCDERERRFYARALEEVATTTGTEQRQRQRFFVCSADLEDELIRTLGVARVEEVIRAEGDLRALQTLQQQPAQQGRTAQQQLRRFLGTKKGRKIHYGRALVEALEPDRAPAPLDDLFDELFADL